MIPPNTNGLIQTTTKRISKDPANKGQDDQQVDECANEVSEEETLRIAEKTPRKTRGLKLTETKDLEKLLKRMLNDHVRSLNGQSPDSVQMRIITHTVKELRMCKRQVLEERVMLNQLRAIEGRLAKLEGEATHGFSLGATH